MRRGVFGLLVSLLIVALTAAFAPASGATGASTTALPPDVPGGVSINGKVVQIDRDGTARAIPLAATGSAPACNQGAVHCKIESRSDSCTGYKDQYTPPKTIKVLTGPNVSDIKTVDFETYVKDVLPNEWYASWDGDSVRSGAVAVTTYAWYWVTHYGGYVGTAPTSTNCFDVTDNNYFQVYEKDSNLAASNSRVDQVWPTAIRRSGKLVPAEYRRALVDPDGVKPDTVCGAGRNGMLLSQTGSEACNFENKYNNPYRYNVILKLYYGDDIDLSSPAQLSTQQDFTYQRKTTGAVFTDGHWTIADGYPTTTGFGARGDVPFATSTGDGYARLGVWRPSNATFYTADDYYRVARTKAFGQAGDIPVPAHYDGLAKPTTFAVFRPANGAWFVDNGTSSAKTTVYGTAGDVPVPGRWTSTTQDSIAVFRPADGKWYVPDRTPVAWGTRGDIALPADYDGNGTTDIAVFRPSTSTFWFPGKPGLAFGTTGDVPVTGDFTGDGKADVAVYRPSTGVLWVQGQPGLAIAKGTAVGSAPFRG